MDIRVSVYTYIMATGRSLRYCCGGFGSMYVFLFKILQFSLQERLIRAQNYKIIGKYGNETAILCCLT